MAAMLNRKTMTAADLDQQSYVATAGYVRDGIYQRIGRLMQENFHGALTPRCYLILQPLRASQHRRILLPL